jgi:hypothetical protein
MSAVKTIGLGDVINPQVFALMSFADFKEAFGQSANYKGIPQPARNGAMEADYKAIQKANGKDQVEASKAQKIKRA